MERTNAIGGDIVSPYGTAGLGTAKGLPLGDLDFIRETSILSKDTHDENVRDSPRIKWREKGYHALTEREPQPPG